MKRATPSLDEAICISATTGELVRAVFTFNLERLGGGREGAARRLVGEAEAASGHAVDSFDPRDAIGAFVVTAPSLVLEAICNHPAVTSGSVYRPEVQVVEARAAVRQSSAAA